MLFFVIIQNSIYCWAFIELFITQNNVLIRRKKCDFTIRSSKISIQIVKEPISFSFNWNMKGLSTLTKSGTKKQSLGLMKIDERKGQTLKDSVILKEHIPGKEKSFYPCAYHVGERITNFCMNPGCLLPLCPKCIKLHS